MKVRVYGAKEDELDLYKQIGDQYPLNFSFAKEILNQDTVHLTQGYDALIIVTVCKITRKIAIALKENGIKYIATRSAGYDHMDLTALREAGIKAANVPFYSPNAIAEHTIMIALNLLRNMKKEIFLVDKGNFTMNGLKGKELGSMTAGVFGSGRIGFETIKLLSSFGCKVLVYDLYPNDKTKSYGQYCSKEELLENSDIVFLHCPLTEETTHLIDKASIMKMKQGVYLVNTARGGLVDSSSVLEALKENKIAGFGFDVYENESDFVRKKLDDYQQEIQDQVFLKLLEREDTIYTAHIAFYTDKAIENMILVTIENLNEFLNVDQCNNELC